MVQVFPMPNRGLTRLYRSEFRSWAAMRNRCCKKNNDRYSDYGGRGIRVSKRWNNSFREFMMDMGPKPIPKHKYTIDRTNNNGHYTKNNCRWATRSQQQRNTRRNVLLTHNGETLCVTEWAERLGTTVSMIKNRVERGWPVEEALTIPFWGHRHSKTATINGETKTYAQWAKQFGIVIGVIYDRLRHGWNIEDAITKPRRNYPESKKKK